uniref:SGTA homodimerisation domain-containing protein n=1 Tax=Meloidogyne incognita TaxID=6306 RepID=A0A914L8W6_MELIC
MDSDKTTENSSSEQFDNKGRITNDERNLIVSFVQFLRHKVSANQCTEDQEAQIEVATQCLEGAFGVSDKNYAFQPSKPLIDIFKAAEGLPDGDDEFPTPTEAEIAQANKLKEEGNELVKQSKFDDAILKYNDAIKLNRDPVYFCNRAAAYCRLEQYDLAIQDCRTALALDPNYAKAYGRMGVALSCQNRYDQAVEAYKKALEIDPSSESYKNNLSIAEEKLSKARETFANNPQDPLGGLGGFGALFNNPDLARSIGAMMQEPGVRNMMQNVMQNMFGGGAAVGGDGNQPGGGGGNPMADMLRAGEAMASVINQANPQLVEMLRRQFGGGGDGNNENNGGGGGNNNSNAGGQAPP